MMGGVGGVKWIEVEMAWRVSPKALARTCFGFWRKEGYEVVHSSVLFSVLNTSRQFQKTRLFCACLKNMSLTQEDREGICLEKSCNWVVGSNNS